MLILRLTQSTEGPDRYRVELSLESDRAPRKTATTTVEFNFIAQEREQLRWYFEDFLEHPLDPAPKIAARIEQNMQDLGTQLFQAVFMANSDTRRIWDRILDELDNVRVEIAADIAGATALPWELLFDPDTHGYLALQTQTFVHTHAASVRTPRTPSAAGPIRILLVICRPGGREDVPFRSVAMRIIKGLSEETYQAFQLDVLRPPTFERLGEVLRQAKADGQPYHVVHFDGHGAFLDMEQLFETWEESEMMERLAELVNIDRHRFSPEIVYPRPQRSGSRGYLAFENPDSEYNLRLVDGPELGSLLVETGVPALVLNACRSAHAEAPEAPLPSAEGEQDVHSQVRAIGSLAQEVMDTGVTGVVAMRYNVYVVTAAQFVANLYTALIRGHQLGQAGSLGRKQLHANPLRTIAYDPRPLQDWPVPVIYEAAPLSIFPKPATDQALELDLAAGEAVSGSRTLDPKLPPAPDVGFFGRDETLLALDRAFDRQQIVLLHAYAGSGKTTTAAEFARWYALTGGIGGPVLFASFEQYKPLSQVLDQLGQMFEQALEQVDIQWLALSEADQRRVALEIILKQIPVLWIWDNVEPVAGFPTGADSAWSDEEQQEMADFLRAARGTKAKFLLTSRREERAWLGDLPARIQVPPMPMQERVQLARAIAGKHSRKLTDVEDWRPLLQFTQGNPLTITVLVSQALRDGLKTKDQIEAFVAQLRAGEAHFEDEAAQGRTKSLSAEEANLLHARRLALGQARQLVLSSAVRVSKGEAAWHGAVISTMQGLRALYDHTGRRAEWRRLVEEIVPDFVDPATDGPLPDREKEWSLVTGYRVRLAREARQRAEAERLQRVRVELNRQRATPLLVLPSETLDSSQRNSVRSLEASLHELGEIQRELEQPECVAAFEESLTLSERIGERTGAAICAFNLGRAYGEVPTLRDLVQAEHWVQRSLELVSEDDRIGKAKVYMQLGSVSRKRFKEIRAAQAPEAELLRHLNAALGYYHQALDLLPPNAVDDLGVAHNQLGNCYSEGGDIDRALNHWRESIRYDEMQGNLYGAAQTRANVAVALAQAGRLADAREYGLAALRNFETFGPRAAAEIEQTRGLVEWIEERMKGEG